jgi:hypothetical protein
VFFKYIEKTIALKNSDLDVGAFVGFTKTIHVGGMKPWFMLALSVTLNKTQGPSRPDSPCVKLESWARTFLWIS